LDTDFYGNLMQALPEQSAVRLGVGIIISPYQAVSVFQYIHTSYAYTQAAFMGKFHCRFKICFSIIECLSRTEKSVTVQG
jgi:hypothetical protein